MGRRWTLRPSTSNVLAMGSSLSGTSCPSRTTRGIIGSLLLLLLSLHDSSSSPPVLESPPPRYLLPAIFVAPWQHVVSTAA